MFFETQMVIWTIILGISGVAAVSDLWKGQIPNWLTLPPLLLAPLSFGLFHGLEAFSNSVIALGLCAVVPLLLFVKRAMGGGDVKLFACIGAIGGVRIGLEIQLFSYIGLTLFSIGYLVWRGKFLRTFCNASGLLLNCLVPKRRRCSIPYEMMTTIRMGGAVLLATLVVLWERYFPLGF